MEQSTPQAALAGESKKPAQLVLSLDLETLVLSISGTAPNNAVCLDMARRAVDELEYICGQDRAAQRDRSIVGPGAGILGRFGRG